MATCPNCSLPLPDTLTKPSLTVAEAAELAGVSEVLARKLIRNGTWPTPVRRFGTALRIPRDALLSYINEGSAVVDQPTGNTAA